MIQIYTYQFQVWKFIKDEGGYTVIELGLLIMFHVI